MHKSTEQSASSGAAESSRGERTQRPQEVSLDIVSRGISSRNPAAHVGDLVEEYSMSCDQFHSVEKKVCLKQLSRAKLQLRFHLSLAKPW